MNHDEKDYESYLKRVSEKVYANDIAAVDMKKSSFQQAGQVLGGTYTGQMQKMQQTTQTLAEIPSIINSLGGEIDTVTASAKELIVRLGGVLTPECAVGGGGNSTQPSPSTSIGSQLEEMRYRVRNITEILGSAINRLAL